jgi:NADH:ubiquinone reductase (H+-translocating)
MGKNDPHVVVLGAGFGGLTFCKHFSHPGTRITLVDRQNHHLFQPLLYQVATAGLSPAEIAQPIRSILAERDDITVLMQTVRDIDLPGKRVVLEGGSLSYDYLILALGGVTSYFGRSEWESAAPGLKSLDDAIRIRRRILLAFERAETEPDPAEHDRLLTVVVVGGGPTGVELAGAFAELARHALAHDFRRIDPRQARVVLVEAGPRILPQFPTELSNSAVDQLKALGVEVRTDARVLALREGCVELPGETILAENIIWAAGVSATPLTQKLGVELDRAGRVKVLSDLSLPGYPEVFAIGDMAFVVDRDGQAIPGVSPAAMQMARHASEIILDELQVVSTEQARRPAFSYRDKGTMATIGRSSAVAKIGNLMFSGFAAWMTWLLVHVVFLIGLRNKLFVLLQWTYSYFTYRKGARIITGLSEQPPTADQAGIPSVKDQAPKI